MAIPLFSDPVDNPDVGSQGEGNVSDIERNTRLQNRDVVIECEIMVQLKHKHICELFGVHHMFDHSVMVLEFVDGGSLYDLLMHAKRLKEPVARHLFKQLCDAVAFAHESYIAHLDIKTENILVSTQGDLKLADWGWATYWAPGSSMHHKAGSPLYSPPEILEQRSYTGPEVDVWCCGIVLYVMVSGRMPFALSDKTRDEFSLPSSFTLPLVDLVKQMLNTDRNSRILMSEVVRHGWVVDPTVARPEVPPLDLSKREPSIAAPGAAISVKQSLFRRSTKSSKSRRSMAAVEGTANVSAPAASSSHRVDHEECVPPLDVSDEGSMRGKPTKALTPKSQRSSTDLPKHTTGSVESPKRSKTPVESPKYQHQKGSNSPKPSPSASATSASTSATASVSASSASTTSALASPTHKSPHKHLADVEKADHDGPTRRNMAVRSKSHIEMRHRDRDSVKQSKKMKHTISSEHDDSHDSHLFVPSKILTLDRAHHGPSLSAGSRSPRDTVENGRSLPRVSGSKSVGNTSPRNTDRIRDCPLASSLPPLKEAGLLGANEKTKTPDSITPEPEEEEEDNTPAQQLIRMTRKKGGSVLILPSRSKIEATKETTSSLSLSNPESPKYKHKDTIDVELYSTAVSPAALTLSLNKKKDKRLTIGPLPHPFAPPAKLPDSEDFMDGSMVESQEPQDRHYACSLPCSPQFMSPASSVSSEPVAGGVANLVISVGKRNEMQKSTGSESRIKSIFKIFPSRKSKRTPSPLPSSHSEYPTSTGSQLKPDSKPRLARTDFLTEHNDQISG